MRSTFGEEIMTMRKIFARPASKDDLRKEFRGFLQKAKENGWNDLKVLFGFAWGNYVYDGDWIEEIMSPADLESRVLHAEEEKDGRIGSDDLYVTPLALGIEHTFCHEGDIHLSGPGYSEYIDLEVKRLRALGWAIAEKTETPNKSRERTA